MAQASCRCQGNNHRARNPRQSSQSQLPVWAGREFESIKRSDVAALMDRVEDSAGPVAADRVLTILSSIFSWYAARNDDYNSPIVRGMRLSNTKERARDRILSDDEIRLIRSKAEGTFGDLVRMLLLTGQRRDKVASMKWDDVSVDGVWSVKNGVKREKGTGGELVLPTMALDIIRARPRCFPGPSGASYSRTYDRAKRALDRAIGPLPQWQLHDLRRTARSLMSRAGVRDEHAERVLRASTIGMTTLSKSGKRQRCLPVSSTTFYAVMPMRRCEG